MTKAIKACPNLMPVIMLRRVDRCRHSWVTGDGVFFDSFTHGNLILLAFLPPFA